MISVKIRTKFDGANQWYYLFTVLVFFFFQHFVRQSFSYKQANICNNSYEINASLLYHKAVIEYLEESKVQIDRLLSYL